MLGGSKRSTVHVTDSIMEVFSRRDAPAETGYDENEDEDFSTSIRQLKHEHDVLLRSKQEMETYCHEVVTDMEEKENAIRQLKKEVAIAKSAAEKAIEERLAWEHASRKVPEVRIRRRRALPTLPGSKGSLLDHDDLMDMEPDGSDSDGAEGNADAHHERLQRHIQELEVALRDSRAMVSGSYASKNDEDISESKTERGNKLSLRDELEVACRDVDDEALCDLAQRMQELTEALEIAHANEAQMQAELSELAERNEILSAVADLADANERKAQRLQDVLDELQGSAAAAEPMGGVAHDDVTAMRTLADEHNEKEVVELRARVEAAEAECARVTAAMARQDAQLQQQTEEKHTLVRRVEALQHAQQTAADERRTAERALHERTTELKQALEDVKMRLQEARQDNVSVERQFHVCRDTAQKDLDALQAKHDRDLAARSANTDALLTATREQHQTQLDALAMEASGLRQAADRSEVRCKKLKNDLEQERAEHKATAALSHDQLSAATRANESSQTELYAALDHVRELESKLSGVEKECDRLNQQVVEKESTCNKLSAQNTVLTEARESKHARTLALEQEVSELTTECDALKTTAASQANQLSDFEALLRTEQTKRMDLQAQHDADQENERKKHELAVATLAQQLEEAWTEHKAATASFAEMSDDVAKLQAQANTTAAAHTDDRKKWEAECERVTATARQHEQHAGQLRQQVSELTAQVAAHKEEVVALEKSTLHAQSTVEHLQAQLVSAEKQRAVAMADLHDSENADISQIQGEMSALQKLLTVAQAALGVAKGDLAADKHADAVMNLNKGCDPVNQSLESISKVFNVIKKLGDNHTTVVQSLEAHTSKLQQEITALTSEKELLDVSITSTAAQLGQANVEIAKLTDSVAGMQETVSTLQHEKDTADSNIEALQTRVRELTATAATTRAAADSAQTQVVELQAARAEHRDEHAQTAARVAQMETLLLDATQRAQHADRKRDEALSAANASASVVEKLKAKCLELASQIDQQNAALAQAKTVFINQKNEIAAARETQQLAEKEMEALKKESERLATLSAEARSVLGKEQASYKEASTKVNALVQLNATLTSELRDSNAHSAQLEAEKKAIAAELDAAKDELEHAKLLLGQEEGGRAKAEREVSRLRGIVELAGANVKKHIDASEAYANDISVLRCDKARAEQDVAKLKQLLDQAKQAHLRTQRRIIKKADTEISKEKRKVDETRRDLEELRKRLARMCDRPDLRQQFLALDDVVATVQQALRTQSAPGITNDLANNGDGVPGFVPTDSITIQVAASIARIGYVHRLVRQLAHRVSGTSTIHHALPSAAQHPQPADQDPTQRQLKPITRTVGLPAATEGDADVGGPVDRLLSAVKRFYVAKNNATGVIAGRNGAARDTNNPAGESGGMMAMAVPPPDDGVGTLRPVHSTVSVPDQEHGMNGASGFAPSELPDDHEGDLAQLKPRRDFNRAEQDKLFQDWCRLKGKVKGCMKQLVSAKAAVAFLKLSEEQTKVYMHNRDRWVARLVHKMGGNKKVRADLLRMLDESRM